MVLSYHLGCRNCLKGDGVRHVYTLLNADEDKYTEKTEYEVMIELEKWRLEDKHSCSFCGSDNVEVYEINASDIPLYDYNKIVGKLIPELDYMLMINIDKKGTHITLNVGGSKRFETEVLDAFIRKIIAVLKNRKDELYVNQPKGNFFVCLTGGIDFNGVVVNVQRFRHTGLTKSEIIKEIENFACGLNLKI
jgi:hypothetical protein